MDNQLKAQEIIKSIRANQNSNANRLQNLDSQVKDLSQAMRSVQEQTAKPIVIEGKEAELKQYINQDGSLQLSTAKKSIEVPGFGLVSTTQKGILDTDKNHSTWHQELKEICKTRSFAKKILGHTPKTDAKLIQHIDKAPGFLKDVLKKSIYDHTSVGAELVPDAFKDMLYESYQTPRSLADNFETVEMTGAGNVLLIPRLNYAGRPFLRGKVTGDLITDNVFTASTPQTAQASITLSGIASRYRVDQDLAEDSLISLIPALTKAISGDLVDAYEDCMINGDTRNFAASQDPARNTWNIRSRWGGAAFADGSDHRQNFNGLRYWCGGPRKNTEVDIGGGSLTAAKVLEMIAKTGESAASQGLMIVTSPEYFIKEFMSLTEVMTFDAMGDKATILTGMLGSIFGVPIVLSRFMGIDLNASGVYDGAVTNQSGVLVVNRSSWQNYQKSGVRIETAKEISSGSLEIVATLRRVLASPDADSTANVAYGYNTGAV